MSTAQPDTGRRAAPGAVAGRDGQPSGGNRRLGLALVVIATAQLMVVLDATIVNVALPHIQTALGFSGDGLEWVVNAYALTFGGLLLLGGRAGDILGRRRVFIAGIILFSVASLLGGFADVTGVAALRPRAAGRRRRDRGTDRVVAGRDQLPGRLRAQQGHGRVRRHVHRRRRGRPAGRRHPDHVRVLALGAVRQRPDRDRRRAAGPAGARRVGAPPGPVRPARRDHQHARPGGAGLRPDQRGHHPERCLALGRHQGAGLAVRGRGAARHVPHHRDAQQVRADAAADLP